MRRFHFILLVVTITIAFVRGWLRLSIDQHDNQKETDVILTINKAQISMDVNDAAHRVNGSKE